MIFFYRILFLPIWLLLMPYYAFRRIKRRGYARRWWQRWGIYETHLPKKFLGKKRIWIHAVSVGELKAVGHLLHRLKQNPRIEVFLTVSTSTAYRIAEEEYASLLLAYAWFPWDFYPIMLLAWWHIQADLAILTEEELWPEFLRQASRRQVPVFLVNARLSDRSHNRYRHLPYLAKWIGKYLSWIAIPSSDEVMRFEAFGLPKDLVTVVGNLKLDRELASPSPEDRLHLRKELGFFQKDIVMVGMSTWPGEESLLLEFLKKIRQEEPTLSIRLLLIPRHAERRAEISSLLKKNSLSWYRRSDGKVIHGADVVLVDTTGELERLALAGDLAFIGKSFGKNGGGQNPLDAAFAGLPMVYGPHMSNFKSIVQALEAEGVAAVVHNEEELYGRFSELIKNSLLRQELSQRLREWVQRQTGATEKVYAKICGQFSIET
jgi:3-deoxy-D-manno-octulosonic-acid transferase